MALLIGGKCDICGKEKTFNFHTGCEPTGDLSKKNKENHDFKNRMG